MFRRSLRGQSTLEYVILIGFVVAALIAMGVYMKRGVQGKLRESTDQIGEQYSAQNTTSEYTTVTDMAQSETVAAGGASTTTITKNQQIKTGSETVTALDNE
jgi:Flp pilus assembly pilin Flp